MVQTNKMPFLEDVPYEKAPIPSIYRIGPDLRRIYHPDEIYDGAFLRK